MLNGQDTLIVMIHVDDAIITGSNPATIAAFKKALKMNIV